MANQTYQLVVTGNAAGQFVQNIFHYRMDDDSYTNRLLAAKGLIDGWIDAGKSSDLLGMLPDTYIMKSLKARRVTDGGGPEWLDISVDGEVGTLGSGMQMSGVGPVIIWFTDGGPRRTGKTYLPGIADENIDGGEIIASAVSALNTGSAAYRAAFNAFGGSTPVCTMCIPRSNDPATRSLIVGSLVGKNLAQMRKRQLPV